MLSINVLARIRDRYPSIRNINFADRAIKCFIILAWIIFAFFIFPRVHQNTTINYINEHMYKDTYEEFYKFISGFDPVDTNRNHKRLRSEDGINHNQSECLIIWTGFFL